MEKEKRLVFPHHTAEWMKLSMRIFSAMTLSYDYMKDTIEWWEDNCLDMCVWLEENDGNDEYLIKIYNALEIIFELIHLAKTKGKEIAEQNEKELQQLINKVREEELSKEKDNE